MADSTVSFDQLVTDAGPGTAEDWARAVFERGPALLRLFVVVGWRWVLGLRLVPRSPDSVAGWPIVERSPDRLVVATDSWLVAATNTVAMADGHVTWTTDVTYRRSVAQMIWAIALPIHRLSIRYLLRRAAAGRAGP